MDPAAQRKMQFLFSLRSHGVTNKRVLTAMEKVDRGKYIRGTFEDRAYEDTPLPIACRFNNPFLLGKGCPPPALASLTAAGGPAMSTLSAVSEDAPGFSTPPAACTGAPRPTVALAAAKAT